MKIPLHVWYLSVLLAVHSSPAEQATFFFTNGESSVAEFIKMQNDTVYAIISTAGGTQETKRMHKSRFSEIMLWSGGKVDLTMSNYPAEPAPAAPVSETPPAETVSETVQYKEPAHSSAPTPSPRAAESRGPGILGNLHWGLGYDEGLCGSAVFDSVLWASLSLFYRVTGPDSAYHQPLQQFRFKLGSAYTMKRFSKIDINVFIEYVEEMRQFETVDVLAGQNPAHKRYNVWTATMRIGAYPQFHMGDHMALFYKVGLEAVFHGTHYRLNSARTDTEKIKNEYTEFGIFDPASDKQCLLGHAIGFIVYVK
jgi:hypothetical protein